MTPTPGWRPRSPAGFTGWLTGVSPSVAMARVGSNFLRSSCCLLSLTREQGMAQPRNTQRRVRHMRQQIVTYYFAMIHPAQLVPARKRADSAGPSRAATRAMAGGVSRVW
jgi:hypothetical protein